jgi:hypothetical protein
LGSAASQAGEADSQRTKMHAAGFAQVNNPVALAPQGGRCDCRETRSNPIYLGGAHESLSGQRVFITGAGHGQAVRLRSRVLIADNVR